MIQQKIPSIPLASFQDLEKEGRRARYDSLVSRLPLGEDSHSRALHYYSSPGRTELGGNHTDHNNGCVLAASVDLDMLALARPRSDSMVTLLSEGYSPIRVDLRDTAPRIEEKGSPASIIRGLAAWLTHQGLQIGPGFDIAMDSRVPAGSGLSSSAAFELLIASIFDDMGKYDLTPTDWAIAGQWAENEYFGKPCGLMDQIACAEGGIVFIDFADSRRPKIDRLIYDFESNGLILAIVNTGSNHEDLTREYADIPKEMKCVAAILGRTALRGTEKQDLLNRLSDIRIKCGDRALLRAWHFVYENYRPARMVEALKRNDKSAYLSIVNESGRSSWHYLQNIHAGNPREQSLSIALMLSEDLLSPEGAWRVHGGGFAGTIQVYVPQSRFPEFVERMEAVFGKGSVQRINIRPFGICKVLMD
ncbi:MAG TPA: galactokinase family protein [Rectinema sp.]|nr:galactokinase [Spirochaetia bacterium]MDI9426400.1 galactokinase family protein [Spirochaetota bacterium]HNV35805.1 galactokinase family protein [Rectinema sp.]HOH16759.1 galactokinase family protein [Rectinema sp.]HOI99066.1 galactokinase family protein [Rectinema sp.]